MENSLHFDSFDWFCKETARPVQQICQRLVRHSTRIDKQLAQAASLAMARQEISIYPLLFRVAYSPKSAHLAEIKELAACLHLLQVSTFVIDDILDKADVRNNQPTVAAKYGAEIAIVVAEILQSIASSHINQHIFGGPFQNKTKAAKLINRILLDVYLGQFLDLRSSGDLNWTSQDYIKTISLTTGSFLSKIARSAALLSGRSRKDCVAFSKFGYCFGMLVQVVDDILDIVASPKLTGKSSASDLGNRRMRLPYILALRSPCKQAGDVVRYLFSSDSLTPIGVQEFTELFKASGVMNDCLQVAKRYTTAAQEALCNVDDHFSHSFLSFLCERIVQTPAGSINS